MSVRIQNQRCLNHAGREAVARCPACGFYFCRECITEHDDRILCASCLKKQAAPIEGPRRSLAWLGRATAACCGFIMAWFFFYIIGRVLLATPTKFHEATVWRSAVEEKMDQNSP
jgi:hypothetical protein